MDNRSASYIQNIEPMRWTPYLEECLEEVQRSNECSTDPSLVVYVRMQYTVEKVNLGALFDGTEQVSGWGLYPPTLHIRALKAQLQELEKGLERDFPQNCKSHNASLPCLCPSDKLQRDSFRTIIMSR